MAQDYSIILARNGGQKLWGELTAREPNPEFQNHFIKKKEQGKRAEETKSES